MVWMASSMPGNKLKGSGDESWQWQIAYLLGSPAVASYMRTN